MKKIFALFIIIILSTLNVHSAEFDTSVDASIRKEYIDSADLPPLPSALPSPTSKTPEYKTNSKTESKYSFPVYASTGNVYTLKRGTKVILASKSMIADYLPKGSIVSFVSKTSVKTKEGHVIPAGTVFRARVTDSHPPQISSNGGLVELSVNEIYYNGLLSRIETKLTNADDKKVFGGGVKGKHSYWSNCEKSLSPSKKFMKGANHVENLFRPIPVMNIICSVVTNGLGVAVYAVNLTVSPVIALFSKGGSLRLPAGTEFKIKISETTQIRG